MEVYGPGIGVTLTELSSSIVVRSEHHYSRDERLRLCLRKHICELDQAVDLPLRFTPGVLCAIQNDIEYSSSRGDLAIDKAALYNVLAWLENCFKPDAVEIEQGEFRERFAQCLTSLAVGSEARQRIVGIVNRHMRARLACHSLDVQHRAREYVGFVDIRMNSTLAPLAMGLLVPPRELRRDPDVTMVSGEYGRIFGAHGFAGTVYSMHEPRVGGRTVLRRQSSCSSPCYRIAERTCSAATI